ncbi:hypothetical protein HYT59_00005, partial [Candidatus Woesebacteria bacterium]|nr:hypothetical protein [Candidatus Woesebacteria bacterium]
MAKRVFLDTSCGNLIHPWGGKLKLFFVLFLLISLYLSIPVSSVLGYYTNMPASVVLGQPDFTSGIAGNGGINASSMNNPLGACSDGNKLAVSAANRVLIWNTFPTRNQQPADLVLGQPDFSTETANIGGISAQTLSTPFGCWTDGKKLVLVDQANKRVLIWNTFPTQNQQAADVVVGQPDFITSSGAATASKLNLPVGVLVYNGKLIVSDQTAHRVLIWNAVPTTNGVAADVVVGQTNFTTGTTGTTASKFFNPRGLGAYDNKLFVGDTSNNRFLIFNNIPTSNGASADVVIGQPDFTTNTANNGGLSCAAIFGGQSPFIPISNGRLFLADGETRRLLIFNQIPTTNFQAADIVLGQSDCAASVTGTTANTFGNQPIRMGAEVNGKLIVGDQANSRILIFNNVVATPSIGLYPYPEAAGNGRLRMRGNVRLGQWDRYSLTRSKLTVSVNGGSEGMIDSLYGLREDAHDNLYEFFHEYDPKPPPGGTEGYTLKFHANSSNADESYAFYFTPFEIKS